MALQTTSQILYDGERNVSMQFTGVCDGFGDEIAALKVDMSALLPVPDRVSIVEITYEVVGGIVRLIWDANDPTPFLELASVGLFNYARIGGMANGGGDTATGNILFTTMGFDAGSSYSIKLDMRKS